MEQSEVLTKETRVTIIPGKNYMRALVLALCVIVMSYSLRQVEVAAQNRPQGSISLHGTVQSVKIVKTSPSSAFIDIKLKLELVNTGTRPLIFLKREPLFVGAALARKPTDFVVGNLLAGDAAWPSNDMAPEWAKLRASLDRASPPSSQTRILAPNESWSLETSVGITVPTDPKRYTSSRKKESLATIQQLSPVWLRVVCEVWPWNVEPLTADRNKLKFGHKLQRRWKNTGLLWLNEIYSEPMMLELKASGS